MAPPSLADGIPRPTKTYHSSAYPAISPSRPELSLEGQTVLITGGTRGIGLETSKAFAQAGVSTIAILARTEAAVADAKTEIEKAYPETKVLPFAGSVTDAARVSNIVKEIGVIDILMLNAGVMHRPAPLLSVDPKEALENFEINVLGPLNVIRTFMSLPPRKEGAARTIIHTSTAGIGFVMPGVSVYNASKSAMTYLMRTLDGELREQGVRVFSFHPAIAFTDMARDVMGLGADSFAYDSVDLPAAYAVWLCSPEADFLRGRFVWSNFDVNELKAKKQLIEDDPSQLTIGLTMDKLVG